MARYIGIDIGAETIKVVELDSEGTEPRLIQRRAVDHKKEPAATLLALLRDWDWEHIEGAAVCGRLGRLVALPRIPAKQAQAAGFRVLYGSGSAAVVSVGSHGFSILELREGGVEVFRENSRCAQGTGNFLRQLVERFEMTVEQAADLAAGVVRPAPLSGRCPVILKTDMTHLANKGEGKDRILAGLFDAIAENVEALIKPAVAPHRIALAGGVARSSRVREHFRHFAERHGMELIPQDPEDGLFLEACGAAAIASESRSGVPPLSRLIERPQEMALERVPSLASSLSRVRRMPESPLLEIAEARDVVLGFDIGSTGSKAVALELHSKNALWEGYLSTNGDPVAAAQQLMRRFLDSPASISRIRGFGATGSGREIVGSLLATCYGGDAVYVLNEIAAHSTGALSFDPRVDTIFEIGGQDAKYIRLSEGRVIDAAMNEACSAGTGSFIEEQGRRFGGVENVAQLGELALASDCGIALGQHCSIFMSEIIDQAVASGAPRESIVAGIYDSVIANYLNRVKGSRSVGQVIFCQGMPFTSDALAAAVARQTGAEIIIPPKPGLMGAVGIAMMAIDNLGARPQSPCALRVPGRAGASASLALLDDVPRHRLRRAALHLPPRRPERDPSQFSDGLLAMAGRQPLDGRRLLEACVKNKDRFICNANQGCGGSGAKCHIDRLTTVVEGEENRFTWGGNCSLYDKGTRKKKLPDLAPDPFRERTEIVQRIIDRVSVRRRRPVIALTDEFQLKGLFPFFATYLYRLGFDLMVATRADRKTLKRGIEEANVPFCAPMQQYHGLVTEMAEAKPDWLFLPMLREIPRVQREPLSTVCPIVQGAPDMLKWALGEKLQSRMLSPVVDIGHGMLDSETFLEVCRNMAEQLGIVRKSAWKAAWRDAREAQLDFDRGLLALGEHALRFCGDHGITPVVVLGRSYTIHNDVLNSNVPSILREQGSIAIPVDSLALPEHAPLFEDVYWGYSQRILRAAWHVRRSPGVYSIYCSNYSCGPDSFTLHTYAWIMEGKPFAVIETDGHSGDAGTKTRVEAFLHCVREDLRSAQASVPKDTGRLRLEPQFITEMVKRRERVLIPSMGPETEAVAAALRGLGIPAEILPPPTRNTLRLGRRHTSGKECLPMALTLGGLLERLEQVRDTDERFLFLMPACCGPCRFGAYRGLHHIVLDRTGWERRVRIWSPPFGDYFQGLPAGFSAIVFSGVAAFGILEKALHDVRPVETIAGVAEEIYDRYSQELSALIERSAAGDLSPAQVLWETATGLVYGIAGLLSRFAEEMAAVKGKRSLPSVLLVGEIYVRSSPFANDFIAQALERRGIRVLTEPASEFLEYSDHCARKSGAKRGPAGRLEHWVRERLLISCHDAVANKLGWPHSATIPELLEAASRYVREELEVETPLTLGAPLRAFRHGDIDATVSVGPLECMPNKIAEAQLFHVAEKEGLLSLTLSLNGDPIDPEVLDSFAFEVHERFRKRRQNAVFVPPAQAPVEDLVPAAQA